MTTHYAPNPTRGLTMCNIMVAPPLTRRIDATADWGLVDCRECKRVAALNGQQDRRPVHHVADINSAPDCGAQIIGEESIIANIGWEHVTCWACIDKKHGASDVGRPTRGTSVTHKINRYGDRWAWCGVEVGSGKGTVTNPKWDSVTCPECLAEGKGSADKAKLGVVDHDKDHVGRPAHTHDCGACVYLDTVPRDEKEYDLYFCPGNAWSRLPTVVSRYGSEGPDYYSGINHASKDPLIALGLVLALKRGLIQYEDALKKLD